MTVLFLPSIDPYAKDWIFLMSFRSPVFFETQHKTVYQNFFWPFSNVVDLWQMKENWVALTKQCLQYKQNSFEWPEYPLYTNYCGEAKKIVHFFVNNWNRFQEVVMLKSGFHTPKKLFYLLQWKHPKNDEKKFFFHLKSLFCSQDI